MLNDTSSKNAGVGKSRKTRVNKNKKRNWRKNIDISAVEDALDIERLELRTGGIISKKADDELFFIDKKFNTESESKVDRLRKKRLRIDQIIVPNLNAVKPASKTSNRVKIKAKKKFEKKMLRKSAVKSNSIVESELPFDLWAEHSLDLYDKETKKTEVAKYTEHIIGERLIKRPKYLENHPSDVQRYKYRNTPAVEVAHPGASYNPTFDDHQDLLAKAHLVEVDKVKKMERITKALHVPYEELPDHDTYAKEMQEGLFDSEEQLSDLHNMEESNADVIANAPVRAGDRKTRRKRRMEEKEKREKEERENLWGDKLRENEVFRTKTFMTEIRAKERKNLARRQLRNNKERLLTLSNVRFAEQDIELKLSDEIKGSLRELKPEAGLLTDRYKSFQKRGIVEPRCKRNKPKRKYKIKYKEKKPWREIEA